MASSFHFVVVVVESLIDPDKEQPVQPPLFDELLHTWNGIEGTNFVWPVFDTRLRACSVALQCIVRLVSSELSKSAVLTG